jgi:hypothetical protein
MRARRRFRLAAVVTTLFLASAFALTTGTAQQPAQAATLYGYDVSWPQCPPPDGYGLPMPPSSAQFVVIGLTDGLPFTTNPCLATQRQWATSRSKTAYAYTMAAYPNSTELNTYGSAGPWSDSMLTGRLANVGYAQAQYAMSTLRSLSWRPAMVWVDVEHRTAQGRPWAGDGAAGVARNRWVVLGLLRGLHEAGYAYGIYASAGPWAEIVGAWRLPGVPTWVTAGPRGSAAAAAMCSATSFSGGRPMLAQWWDDVPSPQRLYDLTCPAYTSTPARPPAPSPSGSDLDADWRNDLLARRAIDGRLFVYRGNGASGWYPALQQGTGWNGMTVVDTPGDIDGNGYPDVLARDATGSLWLYPRTAAGFSTAVRIGKGWNSLTLVTGPGDFSGDGWPDVLGVDPATGDLWMYPRTATGGWLARVRVATGFTGLDVVMGGGDLDGNGMLDLLARQAATGDLLMYPRSPGKTIGPPVPIGAAWQTMSMLAMIGDVNGDTTSDLLAVDSTTGYLWLYPRSVDDWLDRVRVGHGWNTMNLLT